MQQFIKQYWLEVVFGGVLSGLSLVVRSLWGRFKREQQARESREQEDRTEQKLLREAVLAILHDRLYSLARYYISQKWITIQDLDNLEYLYNAYHSLGGNGTGTELFLRCKSLPIRPLNVANAFNEKEDKQ